MTFCYGDINKQTNRDSTSRKLLRCGHVFDETCWQEWLASGQGNIDKCPICKRDVGAESILVVNNDNPRPIDISEDLDTANDGPDRAIQLFQQERNFRLVRLAARFPRYITASRVQRWSSPTYNGSLVQDRSFAQSRPSQPVSDRNQGVSGRSSFGGGTSSGGRGGRF